MTRNQIENGRGSGHESVKKRELDLLTQKQMGVLFGWLSSNMVDSEVKGPFSRQMLAFAGKTALTEPEVQEVLSRASGVATQFEHLLNQARKDQSTKTLFAALAVGTPKEDKVLADLEEIFPETKEPRLQAAYAAVGLLVLLSPPESIIFSKKINFDQF